ncbi:MAG: hypothetical protein JSU04_06740 [Bdellovibrionales bacterium]|nr:hypothetical protein [Bdellovibrionales bacterium]
MKILTILLALAIFAEPGFARRPQPSPTPRWGVNGDCVQLGCFYGHCDFDSDIQAITKACEFVRDGTCVRTLCNQKDDCSMLSRFVKYANWCAGRNY